MSVLDKAIGILQRLTGETATERLEARVRRMPTDDLVSWTESAIVGTGRAYGDWQTKGLPDSLGEALVGAASVVVVLEELERRRDRGSL